MNFIATSTFIFSIILWIVALIDNNLEVLFIVFNILWLSNLIYGISRIKKRFVFVVFQLTFFLFVMGRSTLNYIFYGNFYLQYSNDIILQVFWFIFLSLFVLRIVTMICEKIKFDFKHYYVTSMKPRIDNKSYQLASKYVFWFSYIFSVIYILEKVIFVQAFGYADYYVSFITYLPSIFAKLFTVNEVAYIMFLATNPSKKEIKVSTLAFLLIGILSLGYGQRNPIALRICLIYFIYYPLREVIKGKGGQRWITNSYKKSIIVIIPVLIIFFSFWNFYRVKAQSGTDIADLFLKFFDAQGNSSRILAEMLNHWDEFPIGKNYTFGPFITFLKNNFIYSNVFGGKVDFGFTVEAALNGNNFGNIISYLYSSYHYLIGVGMGSCYIAEVYKDFGYFGIIFINSIYAFLMSKMPQVYGKNVFKDTIILMLLYKIIYAPRDSALTFLSTMFSFTFVVSIIAIYVTYKLIQSKKRKNIISLERRDNINEKRISCT